jgi:hypothetical protein
MSPKVHLLSGWLSRCAAPVALVAAITVAMPAVPAFAGDPSVEPRPAHSVRLAQLSGNEGTPGGVEHRPATPAPMNAPSVVPAPSAAPSAPAMSAPRSSSSSSSDSGGSTGKSEAPATQPPSGAKKKSKKSSPDSMMREEKRTRGFSKPLMGGDERQPGGVERAPSKE